MHKCTVPEVHCQQQKVHLDQYIPNSFRDPNGEQESCEYGRRYEKSEDHFISFQNLFRSPKYTDTLLLRSIVALFNQLHKFFLSLLFIRALRDLLVSKEDVVHTAVFTEVVHGLVL